MAHNDNGSRKKGMILKFKKRRFDGGSEVALIKAIERKALEKQLEPPAVQSSPRPVRPSGASFAEIKPKATAQPATPAKKSDKVTEALIMGPLQLCVALVGMMTAMVGVLTFSHMKNEALIGQSRQVFRNCLKTLGKGMLDTVTGPGKALQAAFSGS